MKKDEIEERKDLNWKKRINGDADAFLQVKKLKEEEEKGANVSNGAELRFSWDILHLSFIRFYYLII